MMAKFNCGTSPRVFISIIDIWALGLDVYQARGPCTRVRVGLVGQVPCLLRRPARAHLY